VNCSGTLPLSRAGADKPSNGGLRMQIKMTIIDGSFSIHRLASDVPVPAAVLSEPFFAVLRSAAELSLVCSSSVDVEAEKTSAGWACLKVDGPLDFDLTGIIAAISTTLSAASVPVFVVSSFDTDYILVRGRDLDQAVAALRAGGIECEPTGNAGT
jgi:hypothetical protein